MKLHFKKTGEGRPLIILHGLFGMSDNWMTLSKQFAENNFSCYLVDLRNHGRSPHSDEFNYAVMAEDLFELMSDESLDSASIIGHSMGGKTAMFFAGSHPEKIEKLVVADMAPRYYTPHHDSVIAALRSIDFENVSSRKEVEEQLRLSLHEESTVQFLLKNLYWSEPMGRNEKEKLGSGDVQQKLAWRFNIDAIEKNVAAIGEALPEDVVFTKQTLFVRGKKSGYVTADDELLIKKHFPQAIIKTVPDAGHWLHAENPKGFMEVVLEFLQSRA